MRRPRQPHLLVQKVDHVMQATIVQWDPARRPSVIPEPTVRQQHWQHQQETALPVNLFVSLSDNTTTL